MFKKFYLLIIIFFIHILAEAQTYYMFVGTYTESGSKGIYVYTFNATTGKCQLIGNTDSVVNPSYLAISANQKYLYAVNETNHAKPGAISSFSFNKKTGMLTFLNKTPTGGDDPCYVSVTKNNRWAFVANYSGGSLSAIPILPDGVLGRYSQLIQFSGSGTNKDRQGGPHAHAAVLSPDEKFVFTPDLGTDKLMEYKFNEANKFPLTPYKPAYFATTAGSGPRHFIFSPDHKHAYLILNYQEG